MEQRKPPIICFAGCDWWYHNRGLFCPQVMTRLAKHYKVLFINSLGMRIPSLKKDKNAIKKTIRKLRSILRFLRKVQKRMYVLSPISLPLGNHIGRKLNTYLVFMQAKLASFFLGFKKPVFYIGCPPALEVIKKFGQRRLMIYERTDLFEEMPGANKSYIESLNEQLTRSADLVLYVNRALWEQGLDKNKNSLLIGHGVDYDLFANMNNSKYVPEDIAGIPKPIIGFFGDISDKTSDMSLLEFIATNLPNMSLVLVGPVSTDVSKLRKYDNVHFLGQKPYEQIPLYGREFDVAIMPWNKNKWIEFCNPIKIKEYLALGKPVVSTYYPEVEPYYDVVYIADCYDTFIDCIHKAIHEQDQIKAEKGRKLVQNETWESKVEQIKAAIEKGLN